MADDRDREQGMTIKEAQPLQARWAGAEPLDLLFADNLHLARVNDQYYLTFGHLRPSVDQPDNVSSAPTSAELRPVVRLVVPKDALERIVKLISRVMED